MSENIDVKLEKLESMRAVFFHASSNTPEEDAWSKAELGLRIKEY